MFLIDHDMLIGYPIGNRIPVQRQRTHLAIPEIKDQRTILLDRHGYRHLTGNRLNPLLGNREAQVITNLLEIRLPEIGQLTTHARSLQLTQSFFVITSHQAHQYD